MVILLGALARRAGVIDRQDGPVLVRVVINLTLPPLIFLILVRADLDRALLLVPVAGIVVHVVLLLLVAAAARLARMDRPRTGALLIASAIGNTGFFGLPLIAASGTGFSQPAAVLYHSLATSPLTWTSTAAIATAYGGTAEGPRVRGREVVRSLLVPPTWALAAGLAVNLGGVDLPQLVERPFEILAAATLPLTMIYAGVMLEARGLHRLWGELTFVVVVKLGIAAVIGYAVAVALGLGGDVLRTVVIMAAMPTAMMSLVTGAREGLRSDVLAAAVVVTTVLATLTLPAWRAVLS
ncbi:MAG TPA: AEC family transporter [Miltoncostaea sp.]|nr:AEC family transporter [Miltoncostaea sp.]